MEKILITGGEGALAKEIVKQGSGKYSFVTPSRLDLDITNINKIDGLIVKEKPKYLIHAAAMTKPMSIHDTDITKSINVNIIGTANIVKVCSKYDIKLIYISTDYVYPANNDTSKECDGLYPINNYGWSKLGGECAVQMYRNSLILRLSFIAKPFPFKGGATNVIKNMDYIDKTSLNVLKVLNEVGVLNIGSVETKSLYELGLETNPNLEEIEINSEEGKTKSIILDITKLNNL